GMGGVSLISQLVGTVLAIIVALAGGFLVYGLLKVWIGIRLTREEEFTGADLSIHRISANSEENIF
ncbi:ammonium transporter, partial [Acinetobacter variabilis]